MKEESERINSYFYYYVSRRLVKLQNNNTYNTWDYYLLEIEYAYEVVY